VKSATASYNITSKIITVVNARGEENFTLWIFWLSCTTRPSTDKIVNQAYSTPTTLISTASLGFGSRRVPCPYFCSFQAVYFFLIGTFFWTRRVAWLLVTPHLMEVTLAGTWPIAASSVNLFPTVSRLWKPCSSFLTEVSCVSSTVQ
jgi:hypothetical protein